MIITSLEHGATTSGRTGSMFNTTCVQM